MTTYLCSIGNADKMQTGIRYRYVYGTREGCRLYASQGVYVGTRTVRLTVPHGEDKVARFAAHIGGDYIYKGVRYTAGDKLGDTAGVIGEDALEKWLSPMAISDASTLDEPKKDNSLVKYGAVVVVIIIIIIGILSQIVRK